MSSDDRASPEAERLADRAAEDFERGRFESALRRADAALAASPRCVPGLHVRAAALRELGRIDEAGAAYEQAIAVAPDDLDLLIDAADHFIHSVGSADDPDPLERGVAIARRGAKLARRAGDLDAQVDLAILEATACSEAGDPAQSLALLEEAIRIRPLDVGARLERAHALFELCRFEEARQELLHIKGLDSHDPWADHMLGLLAERRGEQAEAERHFARARHRSPTEFPRVIALTHAAFDAAVEDALAGLPGPVRNYLSNVAITVEDIPADEDLEGSDPPLSPSILGLFRGSPLGQKSSMDPWSHFPSSIVLYQKNLERFAHDRRELLEEIRITLVHEVGHFLGLSEEELWQRGLD